MESLSSTTASTPSGEPTRRDFLYVATASAGAIGAAATLIPLVDQMNPDAATIAAGAPIDFDLAKIEPGQQVVVLWRGTPIFVIHRTPQILATLQDQKLVAQLSDPQSEELQQPPYCRTIGTVRSSPNTGFSPGYAPILAASRNSIRFQAPWTLPPTGWAAISVPAMGQNTILQAEFSGVPAPFNLPGAAFHLREPGRRRRHRPRPRRRRESASVHC